MKVILNSHPRVTGRKEFEKAAADIKMIASGFFPKDMYVEVNLVGERRMAWLNRTYRERKGVAQILTFAYPDDDVTGEKGPAGEIFLCWKSLLDGARVRKVPGRAYLLRLVVHGICHLKGYLHRTEDNERRMEKVEMKHLGRILPAGTVRKLFA